MLWTLYELLLNLYQAFLFTWFIRRILSIKKKGESVAFWCCVFLTSAALSSYLVFSLPSWDTWTFIFIYIYAIAFFKDPLVKKLYWLMILSIISLGTVGVFYHLISFIFKTDIVSLMAHTLYRFAFTIGVNSLLTFIYILIIKIFKRKTSYMHHFSVLLIEGILCVSLIDMFFTLKNIYAISSIWLFAGCGLTLIVGVLTIYIYYLLCDYSTIIQNYKVKENMLNIQHIQINELQSMYCKMLKLQHDMNAYMKDLKNFSESGSATYLELMENHLHPVPSTGNPVLDSVLSVKYYKMETNQIEFRGANLHYTGGMNISDISLCSLISNMLDNAIESLLQSGEAIQNPYVYLGFSYSAAGLMIICENPIIKKENRNSFFRSTKDAVGHGLGVSIMKTIAEESGGQIDFLLNQNSFKVLVLLPPAKEHL